MVNSTMFHHKITYKFNRKPAKITSKDVYCVWIGDRCCLASLLKACQMTSEQLTREHLTSEHRQGKQ